MKIAVTYQDGRVFQHFGHTKSFKLYDVEDGRITGAAVVDTQGSGHGALAGFLKRHGVDTLICGGIGEGAKNALAGENIALYGGVSGGADRAAEDLLAGRLSFDPDAACGHHDGHEHGDCGHGGQEHGGSCQGNCHGEM